VSKLCADSMEVLCGQQRLPQSRALSRGISKFDLDAQLHGLEALKSNTKSFQFLPRVPGSVATGYKA